ncbi:uncharacterized protein BDW47DRAFT_98757 [Aspergillus candidus]|uniref:Uncharacterized protein n=1 Tax=Aspergillus candidus TaxID=41067 RepID=A0A2I2FMP0_ASPCN|nr:hypothetical protein BDW47DRAFT_98757 [Aspergillus candidus]PLB41900.1 hypothetical protein BDW47DRAFT_98757 [Aspergillus candidus]
MPLPQTRSDLVDQRFGQRGGTLVADLEHGDGGGRFRSVGVAGRHQTEGRIREGGRVHGVVGQRPGARQRVVLLLVDEDLGGLPLLGDDHVGGLTDHVHVILRESQAASQIGPLGVGAVTLAVAVLRGAVGVGVAQNLTNLDAIAGEDARKDARLEGLALVAGQARQQRRRRDQVATTPFAIGAPLFNDVELIAELQR